MAKTSFTEGSGGITTLSETAAIVDSVAWRLFAKAHALQVEKKYDEAAGLYRQIIDKHVQAPEAEMAVVRLARCNRKNGRKSEGKQEICLLYTSPSPRDPH